MSKKILPTLLTAIVCAFFANIYMNKNACKECVKATNLCEGNLQEYKYESGYFGNGKCKIDCEKEEI